nr:response regulator transcription factor [Zoogloeaceae bacterium]
MRILVVDDDPMAGEMIAAVLEAAGHAVVLAENAIAGSERLDADGGFALVVSDLNMPLVSGIEFCEALRADGNAIPFILLTGDEPETLARGDAGVDACLVKDATLDARLPGVVDALVADRARTGAPR